MPFPSEEETPPVTNTYLVAAISRFLVTGHKDTNCNGKIPGQLDENFPDFINRAVRHGTGDSHSTIKLIHLLLRES